MLMYQAVVEQLHPFAFEEVHHGGHDFAPVADLLFRIAAARLEVGLHQIVDGVLRLVRIEHGDEVVVAAAEAAGAFEFALIHHESTDARLPGREGRPAARGPGSEDKEFGFKPDGL